MNRFNHLHWPLIVGMGAFALIRAFANISGFMELLGRPFGPIFMTVFISIIWLAIVVFARVREPVITLTLTAIVYGIFAFALGAILSPILTGELRVPSPIPLFCRLP